MFDWVEKRLLVSSKGFQIVSSLLFSVYKLSQENSLQENMCDIIFEKVFFWKSRGGTERVFMQKQPSKEFFKKGDVSRNSHENICAEKRNSSPGIFLWILRNF